LTDLLDKRDDLVEAWQDVAVPTLQAEFGVAGLLDRTRNVELEVRHVAVRSQDVARAECEDGFVSPIRLNNRSTPAVEWDDRFGLAGVTQIGSEHTQGSPSKGQDAVRAVSIND
jgi:hypothetical protein